MMITDETDEDVANLHDDALFEAYLSAGAPLAAANTTAAETAEMPEWPAVTMRDVGLTIDTATLSWFRANHADWRREMGFILRAWVAAQAGKPDTVLAAAD